MQPTRGGGGSPSAAEARKRRNCTGRPHVGSACGRLGGGPSPGAAEARRGETAEGGWPRSRRGPKRLKAPGFYSQIAREAARHRMLSTPTCGI